MKNKNCSLMLLCAFIPSCVCPYLSKFNRFNWKCQIIKVIITCQTKFGQFEYGQIMYWQFDNGKQSFQYLAMYQYGILYFHNTVSVHLIWGYLVSIAETYRAKCKITEWGGRVLAWGAQGAGGGMWRRRSGKIGREELPTSGTICWVSICKFPSNMYN